MWSPRELVEELRVLASRVVLAAIIVLDQVRNASATASDGEVGNALGG